MRFFTLGLFCFSFLLEANAQGSKLVLNYAKKNKRIEYFIGEAIRIKLKGEDEFFRLPIKYLTTNGIHFKEVYIPLDSIYVIDIRNKQGYGSNAASSGKKIMVVGIGYLLIDWFNRKIVSGQKYTVDKNVMRSSLGMLGLGYSFTFWKDRLFEIEKGKSITVIQNVSIEQ